VMTYDPPGFPPDAGVIFQIAASASDLAGNTLLSTQVSSFGIARRLTRNMGSSATETGYIYKAISPPPLHYLYYLNSSDINVGNFYYPFTPPVQSASRGLLTFNVAKGGGLPANTVRIYAAYLEARQYSSIGSPFPITILPIDVPLKQLDAGFVYSVGCTSRGTCSTSEFSQGPGVGTHSFNVTDDFKDAALDGGRLQYRLAAKAETSNPSASAIVYFNGPNTNIPDGGPHLIVTYDVP
jgi:hypothetical protein